MCPAGRCAHNDLLVVRRLDELFTAWPFLGSRRMARMLKEEGFAINQAGAAADAQDGDRGARRPNTSKSAPGHRIYPYLLCRRRIDRPNQVWAMDISVPQQAA